MGRLLSALPLGRVSAVDRGGDAGRAAGGGQPGGQRRGGGRRGADGPARAQGRRVGTDGGPASAGATRAPRTSRPSGSGARRRAVHRVPDGAGVSLPLRRAAGRAAPTAATAGSGASLSPRSPEFSAGVGL